MTAICRSAGVSLILATFALYGCALPPGYEASRHDKGTATGSLLGPADNSSNPDVGHNMSTPGVNSVPSKGTGGA